MYISFLEAMMVSNVMMAWEAWEEWEFCARANLLGKAPASKDQRDEMDG
jgi:hypothetical protein